MLNFKDKDYLINFVKDRWLLISSLVLFLSGLSFVAYLFVSIGSSEAFVWSRYTNFGPTNFYRDRWYYFYTWPLFVILVTLVHFKLALNTHKSQKRLLSLLILLAGIGVILLAMLIYGRIVALPR